MYSNHWNGSGWSGWIGRGGGFSSNPAADTTGVFALGLDDRLWYGRVRDPLGRIVGDPAHA